MKPGFGILMMIAALTGCSSEKSAAPVDANQAAAAPAPADADYQSPDRGGSQATSALRAAFTKNCPMARFVQNATCEKGINPNEYNCQYVLTGKDAEGMKPIKITGSGDNWDFVERPNAADCENK